MCKYECVCMCESAAKMYVHEISHSGEVLFIFKLFKHYKKFLAKAPLCKSKKGTESYAVIVISTFPAV